MTGILGCYMGKEQEREKMLSYMKKKYGEEFRYLESYAGQFGKEYTAILAESCSYPDRKVLVRLSLKEGEECVEDNYLAWILKGQIEQEMGSLAEECFGKCKICYQIPGFVFSNDLTPDTKVQDFLKNPYTLSRFQIYPENTEGTCKEWEERLEKFRLENVKRGYRIRGTITILEADLLFSMDITGNFKYLRWL